MVVFLILGKPSQRGNKQTNKNHHKFSFPAARFRDNLCIIGPSMKREEEGKYVGSVIQKIRGDPHSFIPLQYAKYLIYLFVWGCL